MRSFDAVIIGGGPAGSSCAWKLRRSGAQVALVDAKAFPRDKICAGWITPQVVAELELDLSDYAAEGRTLQPIRGFRVGVVGQGEVDATYDKVVSYGIRRCEFDTYLLRRCGAETILGRPARAFAREGESWNIDGEIAAPILVGAGGHFCPVAQKLGARLGQGEPIVAAQEAEIPLSAEEERECHVDAELPEIFFTEDLKGYGWVFRKGGYVNIGLGRQDSHRLGDHVDEFVAFLRRRGKIGERIAGKMRGHPYLLYGSAPRPLTGDGVMLIGDAAGLAYPRSGEGIRPAIESGLMAAETILAAGGRGDRDRLAPYERRIVARFGERSPGKTLLDHIPESALQAVAKMLLSSRTFARKVVMDRWFFHVQQAPLS